MRVALFSTCIGDAMFPDAVKATAVVISRLGHEVVFPPEQTCCGQMHVNTGYQREAVPQIENYVDAFSDPSIDCVVAPSGSCTGAVREQHVHVAKRYGKKGLADAAQKTADKTYDLSEFLIDVAGVDQLGAFFPHRVTYHSTCHSLRFLKVGDRPLRLLRNVEGIDLVELPHADECCGCARACWQHPQMRRMAGHAWHLALSKISRAGPQPRAFGPQNSFAFVRLRASNVPSRHREACRGALQGGGWSILFSS